MDDQRGLFARLDEASEAPQPPQPQALCDSPTWRAAHAAGFAIGGATFIAGTACLYGTELALLSAVLYIVGSVGFLAVDVLELWAYGDAPLPLRVNIAMSASGSAFYVAGSVGYLPSIAGDAAVPLVGVGGFVIGSALIAVSEVWKLLRLAEGPNGGGRGGCGGASLGALLHDVPAATAAAVEAGACLGAISFLIGTVALAIAPASPNVVDAALAVWMAGSVSFTCGAAALAYRHAVLRL